MGQVMILLESRKQVVGNQHISGDGMELFEEKYQELIADNHDGWGSTEYERRLNGWQRKIARMLRDQMIPSPPATVLELGCGNSMASYILATLGYKVAGIDISPTAINWAAERFLAAGLSGSFRVGDVREKLSYADGQFDVVIDGDCLHCIVGDARRVCLSEAYRVTRPGGYFLLSSMVWPPRSKRAKKLYDPAMRCLIKDGQPYRYMPRSRDLHNEVNRAGFVVRSHHVKRNAWWNHLTLLAQRSEGPAQQRISLACRGSLREVVTWPPHAFWR